MIKCSTCKEEKPIDEFGYRKDTEKYKGQCKSCDKKTNVIWRIKNKEKIKQYCLNYFNNHREECKRNSQKYSDKNRDKFKILRKNRSNEHRLYCRGRYKNDPIYRLKANVRSDIGNLLKRKKNQNHCENILGYTFEQLKVHLEKQFTNGMSWDNYGQWHIDHIVPVSVFNFESHKNIDFHRCWSLDNLQPLWAIDNLEKHNKLSKPFQPSLRLG